MHFLKSPSLSDIDSTRGWVSFCIAGSGGTRKAGKAFGCGGQCTPLPCPLNCFQGLAALALESVRFQHLLQQQQQQQQQQLDLVKELRCCHRKVVRESVVLKWNLDCLKCTASQLAVVAALNL
jgi:hypothetical protein